MAKRKRRSSKKFIQTAIKKPGSLTAIAKRKGMTVAQFARTSKKKMSPTTRRKVNLYLNVLKRKKG